jgi:hypothetical protein
VATERSANLIAVRFRPDPPSIFFIFINPPKPGKLLGSERTVPWHEHAVVRRALGKTGPAAYTLQRMIERRSWLGRSGDLFMSLAAIGRSPRPATGFT